MDLFKRKKKLELLKIEKGMSAEEIAEKLTRMLERQGIKIIKDTRSK